MTLAAWFCGTIDSDLESLLRHEVDDLAKLKLLMVLRRERDVPTDAAHLARHMGFHSVEQTERKLDELVDCGLLCRVRDPDPSVAPHYTLADDEPTRRRLGKLWRLERQEARFASLLHHLAERSAEAAHRHYEHTARSPELG